MLCGWFVEREEFTAITDNSRLELSKCQMELAKFAEQIKVWIMKTSIL